MSYARRRIGFWGETLLAIATWIYSGAILWGTERVRHEFGPYWQVGPKGVLEWLAYLACFAAWWMALLFFVFAAMMPIGLIAFAKDEQTSEPMEWTNPGAFLALLALIGGCLWLCRIMMPLYD